MKKALLIATLLSVFCTFVIGAKDTGDVITSPNGSNITANNLPPSRI